MSFKLLSKEGSFCSVIHRIAREEPGTLTYIADHDCEHIGDNIIEKVATPVELNFQATDTVLFDANGAGKEADLLKAKGYTVIGGGELNDRLELDRDYGLTFMSNHKIPVPPSFVFEDMDHCMDFIRENPDRYVFKPSGNPSLALTYVATSAENMLGMLPYLKREADKKAEGQRTVFVLQKVVEGVEMSTEAWFNGRNFILPLNSTFEEKKFMDGGKGTQTGCMGSILWNWSQEISLKLYERLFRNMEDDLAEAGYLGPLDINAIWTPNGPFALEFTPRFGFDAIQGFLRTLDVSPATFLRELRSLSSVPARDGQLAMAVAVSTPPYPNESETMPKVPVRGIEPSELLDTVYSYDMMLDLDIGMYTTAGAYNWVCSVTDNDENFQRLRRRVYKKVSEIEVADKQYRDDIGDRFLRDLSLVTKWIGAY